MRAHCAFSVHENRWRVQRAIYSVKNVRTLTCVRTFSPRLVNGYEITRFVVTQKKAIKKQKAKLEALKQEAEEERARARAEARERVLKEFERSQGLASSLAGLRKEQEKPAKDDDTDGRYYIVSIQG